MVVQVKVQAVAVVDHNRVMAHTTVMTKRSFCHQIRYDTWYIHLVVHTTQIPLHDVYNHISQTHTQAEAIAGAKGISLPSDFLDIAANGGLRKSVLLNYITLQGTGLAAWFAAQSTLIRDRLLADPNYLFKCIVEVIIDSGCATVAEVRKRGDDFWREFEFYLSDLIVGLVLDVALVTLITPVAVLGKGGVRKGGRPPNGMVECGGDGMGICVAGGVLRALPLVSVCFKDVLYTPMPNAHQNIPHPHCTHPPTPHTHHVHPPHTALQRYLSTIPTAMFEASIPGMPKYTTAARAACYVVKGLEYSLSGMAAAFVGQGVANALMVARYGVWGGVWDSVGCVCMWVVC